MKVLFVTSWYPSKLDSTNGNFVERHALALVSAGHEVAVVHEAFSNRILFPRIVKEGTASLPVFQVYIPRLLKQSLFFRKLMVRRLNKRLSKEGFLFDIIHGHIIHPIGPVASYISKLLGVPFVFTEHWSGFLTANSYRLKPKELEEIRRSAAHCSCLMPVSESLVASMKALDIPGRYEVVYNAVDTDLYYYKADAKSERFTFLHVSNFAKGVKNVEGIINAFAAFQSSCDRSTELIIAGDGDLEKLKAFAKAHYPNIQDVRFLGTQAYQAVAALMQSVHCFILFSNYENLPCVIAESHCCGIPVIATRVGGVPEMIDAANGALIDPKDEAQLVTTMKSVMDSYDSFQPKVIQSTAQELYGYRWIAEKFESIYKSVITQTQR